MEKKRDKIEIDKKNRVKETEREKNRLQNKSVRKYVNTAGCIEKIFEVKLMSFWIAKIWHLGNTMASHTDQIYKT